MSGLVSDVPFHIMKSEFLTYIFMNFSSSCHTWDAFQLAHASFRLYCVRNNLVLPENSQKVNGKLGPDLIGEPPKINVPPPEAVPDDEEEDSSGALPAIKIYDEDINMRFLVCGDTRSLVMEQASLRSDGFSFRSNWFTCVGYLLMY